MEKHYTETCIECSEDKNRKIFIYDNIFDYSCRTGIYEMALQSFFQIKGYDNKILENKKDISLVSLYTLRDFEGTQIFENIPYELKEKHNLDLKQIDSIMINLCTPHDRFHVHTDNDSNGLTLIYYLNLEWNIEWGGDTCFLKSNGVDFEHIVEYKPGRLVLFHPQIPHIIRPSTSLSPYFRFTLAAKFLRYG